MRKDGSVRLLVLALPGLAALAFFFLLPLAAVVSGAIAPDTLRRLFASADLMDALLRSLSLGAIAGLVSLIVAIPVALHLSTLPAGLRSALQLAIALPLTFSGLIVAYGFILVFGRAGFATLLGAEIGIDPSWLSGLLYSPVGLVAAYAYFLIPRAVLILLPVLLNFDWRQVHAAESLGAGRLRALYDILFPQLTPSLFSAFCLMMAIAIGAYGTALALIGSQINILPLRIYSLVSDSGADFPLASAASLLLMAVCTLVMAMAEIFSVYRESKHVRHR